MQSPSIEFPPRERDEQRLETRCGEIDVLHRAALCFRDTDERGNQLAAAIAVRAESRLPSFSALNTRNTSSGLRRRFRVAIERKLDERPTRRLRPQVIRRKISGGTRSEAGRACRDAFLGLLLTCAKLGVSFWDYLGHRLGVPGADAPHLPDLVRLRSAPA